MSKIKKPTDEELNYIKNNFTYNKDTGEVYGVNGHSVGSVFYYPKSGRNIFRINISISSRKFRRYHVIWFLHYGAWPEQEIDHKDRNPLNDKVDNLIECTSKEQQRNKPSFKNRHGFYIEKRKYNYRVRNIKEGIILGHFKTKEEAEVFLMAWLQGKYGVVGRGN